MLFSDLCPDDSRISITFPQYFIEAAKKKSFAQKMAKSGMKPFVPQDYNGPRPINIDESNQNSPKGSLMSSKIDNAMNMMVN